MQVIDCVGISFVVHSGLDLPGLISWRMSGVSFWCMDILDDCVLARKMKNGCASFDQLGCEGHCQDMVRPKHSKHCQIHIL